MKHLKVGDVIQSDQFEIIDCYDAEQLPLSSTIYHIAQSLKHDSFHDNILFPEFKNANFVIEKTNNYNKENIIARKLKIDGTYDPNGVCIEFYISFNYTSYVNPENINIIKHMERSITFN